MAVVKASIESAGYKGRADVIHDIHFEVEPGELVGLIGPNGAGKSTTIKALLGLLPEVKGDISFGEGAAHYAYIPEHPVLYENLTLWEHLELAASAMGLSDEDFRERAEELLVRYRLTEVRHHLTSSFSKGMQQKIMLVLGFLHRAELYIVDEPFIGLDPKAIRDFLAMLDRERERGAGVLMSTHVLDTAEKICSSFLLVSEGGIVASGTLEDIRQACGIPGASLFECFTALTEGE
ncbi:ABC transporter ATP-binding protein [Gorillibacterium timonense]|uniref:ABC transporter ATP-binding protein n=1 Tax=Gorillibacterium timonense TaxID=1689269 RepID=UPI00071DC8BA|nr:ABC transporter ATP-binding protein [Gorillibacterium timonense]